MLAAPPRARTLDDVLRQAVGRARDGRAVRCPVCGGEARPVRRPGLPPELACRACGSTLELGTLAVACAA